MRLEKDNFVVEYDESLYYIPEMVRCVEENAKSITAFFGLYHLDNKVSIIMYKDLELYKKHIEKYFDYQDYMCGDTMDGNINLLSLEAAHKTKWHANMTLDELKKVALYEFVHICQQTKE